MILYTIGNCRNNLSRSSIAATVLSWHVLFNYKVEYFNVTITFDRSCALSKTRHQWLIDILYQYCLYAGQSLVLDDALYRVFVHAWHERFRIMPYSSKPCKISCRLWSVSRSPNVDARGIDLVRRSFYNIESTPTRLADFLIWRHRSRVQVETLNIMKVHVRPNNKGLTASCCQLFRSKDKYTS